MKSRGYTIVELVIVIAVIGILIVIMAFGLETWRSHAATTAVKSDMIAASAKLKDNRNWKNAYPADSVDFAKLFTPSSEVTMTYTLRTGGASYCLRGQSVSVSSVNYYYDSTIGGDPTTTACS